MALSPDGKSPDFKVVFVGDAAVGKTSLILRYHRNCFVEEQQSTIGSAFVAKQIETRHGLITLNIWDTAGQERYRSLVPMYSRGAYVVILVFDVSDADSFKQIQSWINIIREDLPVVPILLCGNKCDLPFAVPQPDIMKWAEERDMTVAFVSAKEGQGVAQMFTRVGDLIPAAELRLKQTGAQKSKNLKAAHKRKCC